MNGPSSTVVVHLGDFLSVSALTPLMCDVTERSIQEVGAIVRDFERALDLTDNVSRSYQLRERITACIQLLATVEREAFD